jgi:plasmid stability protein
VPSMLACASIDGGVFSMASLSIRRLDERTVDRLRIRAARRGVSMEEEARSILCAAVSGPERIGDLATSMFGPTHGVDLDLPVRTPHQPADLGE